MERYADFNTSQLKRKKKNLCLLICYFFTCFKPSLLRPSLSTLLHLISLFLPTYIQISFPLHLFSLSSTYIVCACVCVFLDVKSQLARNFNTNPFRKQTYFPPTCFYLVCCGEKIRIIYENCCINYFNAHNNFHS